MKVTFALCYIIWWRAQSTGHAAPWMLEDVGVQISPHNNCSVQIGHVRSLYFPADISWPSCYNEIFERTISQSSILLSRLFTRSQYSLQCIKSFHTCIKYSTLEKKVRILRSLQRQLSQILGSYTWRRKNLIALVLDGSYIQILWGGISKKSLCVNIRSWKIIPKWIGKHWKKQSIFMVCFLQTRSDSRIWRSGNCTGIRSRLCRGLL